MNRAVPVPPRAPRPGALTGARRVALGVVLGTLAVLLAACSGIPEHSSPEVVRTVPIDGAGNGVAATTPAPGISPRVLVSNFLEANVADASSQTSPREFLTAAARRTWSDSTVTVVDDPVPGIYDPATGSVQVRAQVLGTVDATGQYSAANTSQQGVFRYQIKPVDGQNRIDGLPDGLLLSESNFQLYYTQRPVYYFGLGHHYLVPDPRWTSLNDPTQLANWLMAGLTSEPSDEIKNTVEADTLPPQVTARRISVKVGSLTTIEIPGSSQLPAVGRDRLAEQVATTLADVPRLATMQITDGGRAVRIPDARGSRFSAGRYAGAVGPPTPAPSVYFLRNGFLYDQNAHRLRGKVNDGSYGFLQSVAVSPADDSGALTIAATAGKNPADDELLVGSQADGLRPTKLRGPLTRPAFAPGRSEAWVGDGQKLYAVTIDNDTRTQRITPVALPSGSAGGTITSVRLSPDGARLAIVLRTPRGGQLYVAAVIRGPGQIRIDTPQPVMPAGVTVSDVAWAEPLKLLAIGTSTGTPDHRIYTVGTDGSEFNSQSIGNLPNNPTTVTVATGQPAWVTASGSVWQQYSSASWISPGPSSTTRGYAAVYLE